MLNERILSIQNELQIAEIESEEMLETFRLTYLSKNGVIQALFKEMGSVPPESRAEMGQKMNALKTLAQEKFQQAKSKLEGVQSDSFRAADDISIPADPTPAGSLHPLSITHRDIKQIFYRLGFTIADGPELEDDFHNFTALNFPPDHPARDMQDTFYFENGAILRTHTSAIQVRGMEKIKPPFKVIGPGKVFRVERPDATHEAAFHQLEGMVVGEDINVAQLISTMKTLLSEIFKRDVDVRLRPGFFPFVEPGFELDIACQLCGGKGCSVCKHIGWIELMPCGMVHPNVLRSGGIDPEKYSGFAFGLGLDRLVMMRYKIEDIRNLHSGDLRFSGQFV